MKRPGQSLGLLGWLLTILLLALGMEFIASTVLYERSSRALIRDDEAHRLAEHLVIARKLMSEQPAAGRPAMAVRLSTDRYDIHWSGARAQMPARPEELSAAHDRVIEWEPSLHNSDLRVRLVAAGWRSQLFGALRLNDGTLMRFRANMPPGEGQPRWHLMLMALLLAASVVVVGAIMVGAILRPIRMLARATERIGRSGGLTLPESGPADVRNLIRGFNAMQARIHQLIEDRTQALAAVGHDLRTPLARLKLRAEAISDGTQRRAIEVDVSEMEEMVGSLLAYLGGDEDPEPPALTDIAVMAATIVDDASDRGADAVYLEEDHVEARVRQMALKRAVANLVENALHYGGAARVSVIRETENVVIRVDDDGPGIPNDQLTAVLEPFARLDTARSRNTAGLGLGLSIVVRAAEMEGGTLVLANRPGGGLRAEIVLPSS